MTAEPNQSPSCPICSGRGSMHAFVDGVRDGRRCGWQQQINCPVCEGTGIVSPEKAAAMAEGKRRRDDRVGRRLSHREEAERLGITPRHLSDLENGRRTDWPL